MPDGYYGFMRLALSFVIALFCFVPSPARAWNAVGHMVVAKLAIEQLTTEERARLIAAFKEHPHFEQYLAAQRPEGASMARPV